jgi:hypothetical protein
MHLANNKKYILPPISILVRQQQHLVAKRKAIRGMAR